MVAAANNAIWPRRAAYRVGSGGWGLATNAPSIEAAFGSMFERLPSYRGATNLEIRLRAGETASTDPYPAPLFRGREHLVMCRYGDHDCLLIDLLGNRVAGKFSRRLANDADFWRRAILPVILGVACPSIGVTPIHAACLDHANGGLLLSGESGAGKSTLAVALACAGMGFISDDWTYLSRHPAGAVEAWSPPVVAKLLPDAAVHFPELEPMRPVTWMNGEAAYEVDATRVFGARIASRTAPRWIVFYERTVARRFEMARVTAADAFAQLERTLEELPQCLAEHRLRQLAILRDISRIECWQLRAGGSPQEIGDRLTRFCASAAGNDSAPQTMTLPPRPLWPDMLRRRVPAPHRATVMLGSRGVFVESETQAAVDAVRRHLPAATDVECRWRMVLLETDACAAPPRASDVYTDGGLSFVSFGRAGFAAADAARCFVFAEVDRAVAANSVTFANFLEAAAEMLARCGSERPFEPTTGQFDRAVPAP